MILKDVYKLKYKCLKTWWDLDSTCDVCTQPGTSATWVIQYTKNVPGAWRLLFCNALPGNFPSTKIKSHSLQMPSHWTRCVHDTPPFSWIAHASMLEISNTSFYQLTMADYYRYKGCYRSSWIFWHLSCTARTIGERKQEQWYRLQILAEEPTNSLK